MVDAQFERELERTEATLIDIGATGPEIEAAIGRDGGYWRKALLASRAEQISAVAVWLASGELN
jgi:hypothetical protein